MFFPPFNLVPPKHLPFPIHKLLGWFKNPNNHFKNIKTIIFIIYMIYHIFKSAISCNTWWYFKSIGNKFFYIIILHNFKIETTHSRPIKEETN